MNLTPNAIHLIDVCTGQNVYTFAHWTPDEDGRVPVVLKPPRADLTQIIHYIDPADLKPA